MISSIYNINIYKNVCTWYIDIFVCRCILFQSNLFIMFEYLTAVRSASDWIDPRTLAKVGEMTFLITLPSQLPARRRG